MAPELGSAAAAAAGTGNLPRLPDLQAKLGSSRHCKVKLG